MNRKDSKGRVLRVGEYERSDGRYVYRFTNTKGKPEFIYSWRLIESDAQPKGKPICESLRELEKAAQKDVLDGIERTKVTLNDRWDKYIESKLELKQSTATNYKYMYNKYVRDDIGQLPIKSITYSTCKKFMNELVRGRGFKLNSLETINTLLHPVFETAVKDGLIRINPTGGIMADLKKSNDWIENKRHALTRKHQIAFVQFTKDHPIYNHWYPIIVCFLGTGCRMAELLGLRWKDIYWKENIISINHNLIYRLQDDGSVQFRITTTKTKNGKREIPMFASVAAALKQEYNKQQKEGFCTQEIDGYSGFIWKNKIGQVLSPASINRMLDRIRLAYNTTESENAKKEHRKPDYIPQFTAHHLRHTFCTRLCEEETDIKLIQEIMGHANISTTMDIYNESNTERKKERFAALEKVSNVF